MERRIPGVASTALLVVAMLCAGFLVFRGVEIATKTAGDDGGEAAEAEPTTTTTDSRADRRAAVTCPGADGRSRELRLCLEDSFAFIESPIGAGSGVLLDDGHIVTNAHVVDPYREVWVTFSGGETFEAVEVLGVDAFTDIAVLGPIDVDREGLVLGENPDFDVDDEPEVFLVGYPGGVEGDDPRVTLSSGILSRIRDDEEFDATYLQTDAAIAGGQSGGALVDGNGRLLGISGLSFAEEFALALSVGDVADAVDRILAGDGDDWRTMPTLEEASSDPTDIVIDVADGFSWVVIPAAEEDRTIRIDVGSDRPIAVDAGTYFEGLGANQAAIDAARESLGPDFFEADYPLMEESAPGQYSFEAPGFDDVIVTLSFADRGFGTIRFGSSAPYVERHPVGAPEPIQVGAEIDVIVDSFVFEDLYAIELVEGDEIEISVRSPVADPYYVLIEPGELYRRDLQPTADDGGGGLWDLDALDTHRIRTTGTYLLAIGTYDGIVGGYHLRVTSVG
jgi:S1-C subfamily serine protease